VCPLALWDLDDKKKRLHKTTQQRFYAKPATWVAGMLHLQLVGLI
jgi:hypothetical protein